MAVYLTVSEIQRQKWTGGSFYPPLAGIRVKPLQHGFGEGNFFFKIKDVSISHAAPFCLTFTKSVFLVLVD